ncbi:ImmA/IrrE family metallo-endopeptidase [Devosia sp.]|uniref:ImmA/IrrE family metallo-endopeptidase n=1 Tax=Devosia sp. TaxID=1871048 RepID=UPI001B28C3C9|nr:ImmA/IrrE family metallo-endopeptidase [Devosia sp.]MBO9588943.1 ImmA/IrrE family metallo-endopeptidase [Devosia sp.]
MNYIEQAVIRLRVDLGIPNDLRPDLLDTLRRLRIAGVIRGFGPKIGAVSSDIAARWDPAEKWIFLSDAVWDQVVLGEEDPELRFTILHEIGHAALRHSARNRKVGNIYQHGRSVEREEEEADDFARAFAIPLNFISNLDIRDATALSERFGLSREATEKRMVDLQRHARTYVAGAADEPEDNYAEAMTVMSHNARNWNL